MVRVPNGPFHAASPRFKRQRSIRTSVFRTPEDFGQKERPPFLGAFPTYLLVSSRSSVSWLTTSLPVMMPRRYCLTSFSIAERGMSDIVVLAEVGGEPVVGEV